MNMTGYMRSFMCEVTKAYCAQPKTEKDVYLEIGCGLGVALGQMVLSGAKNIVGVDSEPLHLTNVGKLLEDVISSHPDVNLRLECTSLPNLSSLKPDTFRSILCAQVLHYLRPDEFIVGLKRLRELLKKDGTIYMTIGSPYLDVYKGFAEEYAKRFEAGNEFPGYMEDVRQWHPKGATHNAGFFLFFDPVALKNIVSKNGFTVLESFSMDSSGSERGQTGLIAVKS